MIQTIGSEFSDNIPAINLIPGVNLTNGLYIADVTSVSVDRNGNTIHNMTSWQVFGTEGVFARIGHDILYVSVHIYPHHFHYSSHIGMPKPSGQHKHTYYCSIRVDELILLNIAAKLLKKGR